MSSRVCTHQCPQYAVRHRSFESLESRLMLAATFANLPFSDPYGGSSVFGQPSQPLNSVVLDEPLAQRASSYSIPAAPQLANGADAITIEWWLATTNTGLGGNFVSGPGFSIGGTYTTQSFGANFTDSLNGVFDGNRATYFVYPPDGQWHYYAVTYDTHEMVAYIDGQAVVDQWVGNNANHIGPMVDGTNVPSSTTVTINSGFGSGTSFDHLRISNVALTPAEVRANLNNYRPYSSVYYASSTGSVFNPGTPNLPMDLSTALAQAGPGAKIVLAPGTYSAASFQIAHGGTDVFHPVLITGADGSGQAIIQATGSGTTTISGLGNIVLRNLTFSADQGAALTITNATSAITLDSCRLSSNQNGLVATNSPHLWLQNNTVVASGIGLSLTGGSTGADLWQNTIVGGTIGLSFTSASHGWSAQGNLVTGQTSACLFASADSLGTMNGTTLQGDISADYNIYNPSGAASLANINGIAYTKTQLSAYQQAQYTIAFPTDAAKSLPYMMVLGPEIHSFLLAPTFVDASHGDYRLAAVAGNAIDIYDTQQVSYDATGAARLLGNAVDAGAYETAGPLQYTFTLTGSFSTSAGVFNSGGTLIRTLWKARPLTAGNITAYWNGLTDDNTIAPAGTYTVKLLTDNVNYVWEGVIGNNSASFNGPYVHNAFQPMQAMTFVGTSAFYCTGYNEGQNLAFRFDTTAPQSLTAKLGSADANRAFNHVDADATRVYYLNTGGADATQFVTAFTASNNAQYTFSAGTTYGNWSGVAAGTQGGMSGLAVQRTGNYLFIANSTDNKIYILNKITGAALGSFNVTAPGRLALDPATNDLWVISGSSVLRYTNITTTSATLAATISGLDSPLALAVDPTTHNVLVSLAGTTQQVKCYNTAGVVQWTLGQLGGYANGPTVTTDKFQLSSLLAVQPDGSFWVGDGGTYRNLHFNAQRQYLNMIMWIPANYAATVDPNNPTRVFAHFLEFQVDYSKPLAPDNGSWTLVRNWSYGLPSWAYSGTVGFEQVFTLSNNRTYALLGGAPNGQQEVFELPANGNARASTFLNNPYPASAYHMNADGSLNYTANTAPILSPLTNGIEYFYRKTLTGFNSAGDPSWSAQTTVASAPLTPRWNSQFQPANEPVGAIWYYTPTGNIVTYSGSRFNNGWQLGAVQPGTNTQWLWKQAPSGPLDGQGTVDTNVEYVSTSTAEFMVSGDHILFEENGEIPFGYGGQENQFSDYYSDGLFIGQFGELGVGVGSDAYQSRIPGFAGNGFATMLVQTNGQLYLYLNDESGHGGNQRWRIDGYNQISELTGTITLAAGTLPAAPAVAITSPAPATVVSVGTPLTLTASTVGTNVRKVDFYANGVLIGSDLGPRYSITYTPTLAGACVITAVATDLAGHTGTSAPLILQIDTTITVALTNAATFNDFSPINLTATATSTLSAIARVDFYNGATLLGSSTTTPFAFTWNSAAAGTYTITAIAVDSRGVQNTSAPLTITVTHVLAPAFIGSAYYTTSVTFPVTSTPSRLVIPATLNGSLYSWTVGASGYYLPWWNNVASPTRNILAPFQDITTWPGAEYANGNTPSQIQLNGTLPTYAYYGDTITRGNGSYVDLPINVTDQNTHLLTIVTGTRYNSAPQTTFRVSGTNGTVSYTVPADHAPAVIQFKFVGNITLRMTQSADYNDPYTYSTIAGLFFDTLPTNQPPTSALTSVANNTTVLPGADLLLTAAATDADGTIRRVDFYDGATLLGSALQGPYAFTWNNVPAGDHTITAVAIDDRGAATTSTALTLHAPALAAVIASPAPNPRQTSVSSLALSFNRAVTGLDLSDLQLTRDGQTISLASATLTTSDNINFTLNGLAGLTSLAGSYLLTLPASTATVYDAVGNTPAADAITAWTMNAINAPAAGSTIRLTSHAGNPNLLDIAFTGPTTSSYTLQTAGFPQLLVNGLSGSERLTLDFTNGNPFPLTGLAWDGGTPSGSAVLELIGASAGDAFTLSATQVLHGIPVTFQNTASLWLQNGVFNTSADLAGLNLTVNAGATVNLNTTNHLGAVTLNTGGRVQLPASGSLGLIVNSLIIAGGVLDLANNPLIVHNGVQSTLTGYLKNGYNAGTWTGPTGILSSYAALPAHSSQGFGMLSGLFYNALNPGQPVAGLTPAAGDVVIKYTYLGDVALNGSVSADDFAQLDASKLRQQANPLWFHGDFNYDGVINASDYAIINTAFASQATHPLAASVIVDSPLAPTTPLPPAAPANTASANTTVALPAPALPAAPPSAPPPPAPSPVVITAMSPVDSAITPSATSHGLIHSKLPPNPTPVPPENHTASNDPTSDRRRITITLVKIPRRPAPFHVSLPPHGS